jgi:hypothetical protein
MYPPPPPGSKDVQYLVQVPPSVVLNPAIANEVTMGPVSVTLVYQKQYSGMDRAYNPNYLSSTALSNFTLINNVYGNEWYAFSAPYNSLRLVDRDAGPEHCRADCVHHLSQ